MVRRRRRVHRSRLARAAANAALWSAITWLVLTEPLSVRHGLAELVAVAVFGLVLGLYARFPIIRVGPMKITFGHRGRWWL